VPSGSFIARNVASHRSRLDCRETDSGSSCRGTRAVGIYGLDLDSPFAILWTMSATPLDSVVTGGTLLTARDLGKRFESNWIFRGLSFEVKAGDGLMIIGRNGAGKSTLLRALAGLVTPTEGKVDISFEDLRSSLSMAALDQSLYPHLTVREHLELFGKLRGCAARADELLSRIGLEPAADRFASKLSTGMKSRLKLALAIQPNPELLLLDEPGAALDEAGKELVASICEEQRARGALIIATNDPSERRFGTHELELS
jgi:heme exporter protein A